MISINDQFGWAGWLNRQGALVLFGGGAADYHVDYDGEHWNGFFFQDTLRKHSPVLKDVVKGLSGFLDSTDMHEVTHVMGVGENHDLVSGIATEIGNRRGRFCEISVPTRGVRSPNNELSFFSTSRPSKGSKVLLVDCSLRFVENTRLMVDSVVGMRGDLLPHILTPFNPTEEVDFVLRDKFLKVGSLTSRPLEHWKASVCPLCKCGSVADNPEKPRIIQDIRNKLVAA